MKVTLAKFGIVSDSNLKSLFQRYEKKISAYTKLEIVEVKDTVKDAKRVDSFQKIREKSDYLVLLDERGKQLNSREQALWLSDKMDNPSIKSICFCVGNAHGFNNRERSECNYMWSLSKSVFPNELCWVMLAEQIYRSYSILNNSPYHHD